MKTTVGIISIFVFLIGTVSASEINDLPPFTEPITINYCNRLFGEINDYSYFTDMKTKNENAGNYAYSFGIGYPQLPHLVQAMILGHKGYLYNAWWRSERRDTRIIASALLFALEPIEVDVFKPPMPYRYNTPERVYRIEEMAFVTENLQYFYQQFLPIFEKTLGKEHPLVKALRAMPNLKSDYLKYDPETEPHLTELHYK